MVFKDDDTLFSIGDFARICRLSVKQLRRYDEIGLLPPAHVDSVNGYRYYQSSQIRVALTIALLRELDMPLGQIPAVLNEQAEDTLSALQKHQKQLEQELRRSQSMLASVTRLLEQGLSSVVVRQTIDEPLSVIATRTNSTLETLGHDSAKLISGLLASVGPLQGCWSPPVMGLYPVDLVEPLEIGVAVQAQNKEIELPDGCYFAQLPGAQVATTVHTGPYSELRVTYHELFIWIHEHRLQPYGLVRETYLNDPTTTSPQQLQTRLAVPVKHVEG